MKPQSADLEVRSTLQGDKIDMTFDENSLTHLMSVLTDLYSDPELAVIREYSTNAFDAHVEAGVSDPIEITLPTDLAPFFRVRDHGIGLSHDDIRDIYSKYGASSKRETDEQTGMLGLGCKSALTYSNQFSLVGVKDGRKVTVSIGRDEDGAGSMTVVEDTETDEPNGVEVIVPARRPNRFREKSNTFFQFWPAGSVTINGEEPHRPAEALDLADDLAMIPGNGYEAEHVIVMGNVSYPVPAGRMHGLDIDHYSWKMVARVPIGAVNFTPSREELQYTKRTEAVLRDLIERFNAALEKAINDKIEQAPSPWEALRARTTWRKALRGLGQAKIGQAWHGHPMPASYPNNSVDRDKWPITTDRHAHVKGRHSAGPVSGEAIPGFVWVIGFDYAKFSHVHKRKLEAYCARRAAEGAPLPEFRSYALTRTLPDIHWWIDPERVIDWQEVKAIKLPKAERTSSGRIPGAYDVLSMASSRWTEEVEADDLDPDARPTYYLAGPKYKLQPLASAIHAIEPDAWIVWMQERREAKFLRHFPNVASAESRVRTLYAIWRDGLSAELRRAIKLAASGELHTYAALDARRLSDPNLAELARLANNHANALTAAVERSKLFHSAIYGLADDLGTGDITAVRNKYPLFDRYDLQRHPEHMYLYLNAAYAAEQEA